MIETQRASTSLFSHWYGRCIAAGTRRPDDTSEMNAERKLCDSVISMPGASGWLCLHEVPLSPSSDYKALEAYNQMHMNKDAER
ncbi:hypothetical protein D3C84_923640 [compost metagenome]